MAADAPKPRAAWLALEELRGGPVRVLCRLRPPARDEGGGCATRRLDDSTLLVADSRGFSFDAVFSPGSQEEVFESCRDLLQVVAAGGCASLLAYGHGGSGKTFTLAGVPGQEGVLPRAADELFRLVEGSSALFDFEVSGSVLAVHNDDLVDLLASAGSTDLADKLSIRYHKSGKMFVEHLSEEICSSSGHLKEILERGIEAKGSMTSSKGRGARSHLVFTITVARVGKLTGEKAIGKLVAVDLAGPERLKHLQPTQPLGRQTFRESMLESIEVNRSLWALSDVIQAVTGKSKAVPYRNHRLTQLLQDVLGSAARSVLIVTCSPARASLRQTLASLRFASRAKNPPGAVLAGTPRSSQGPSVQSRSDA